MKLSQRILAAFLAVLMTVGALPVSAMGAEAEVPSESIVETTTPSTTAETTQPTEVPTTEPTVIPVETSAGTAADDATGTEVPTEQSENNAIEIPPEGADILPAPESDAVVDTPETHSAPPAPELHYNIFTYKLLENSTICITGHTEGPVVGHLNIPSQIDGIPVTEIGGSAFSGCTEITSVSIPDSVTKIEEFAFSRCTAEPPKLRKLWPYL